MSDCLFCKIVKGEIPSTKHYEDDNMIIISDILGEPKIHYLLIPKKHFTGIEDKNCDFELLKKCFIKISELSDKLGLSGGYRLAINYGKDSGQSVPHLHIHILAGEKLSDKFW